MIDVHMLACKGVRTPSVSVNADAWNDSMDLYCVTHTERHPKRRAKRQR